MVNCFRILVPTMVLALAAPSGAMGLSFDQAPMVSSSTPITNLFPANVPSPTVPVTSAVPNDFMDLERDLTSCISSNPRPGCGREPTSSSDRGGWQQFLLFGIMMVGIGIIFWRVGRSIRIRDRSMASPVAAPEDVSS